MTPLSANQKIITFKNQVVDISLLIAIILSVLSYVLIHSKLVVEEITLDIVTDLIAVSAAIILFLFRKRLSLNVKTIAIILILFEAFITDLLTFGVFSVDKVLIVVVPFYAILAFSFRKTLAVFFIALLSYLFIGYLFAIGKLQLIEYSFDNSSDFSFWVESILIVSISAAIILIFTYKYNQNISNVFSELGEQNKMLKQSHSELLTSETKLKEIFNATNEAFFIMDTKTLKIIDINTSMLKMFGYLRREEVCSNTFDKFTAIELGYDFKKLENFYQDLNEEKHITSYWMAKRKNGEIFPVEVSIKAVTIGNENVLLFVIRDLSEKERIKKEIEESNLRYKQLVEAFPDIIMISDLQGNIVYGNDNLEKFTGIGPTDYRNPERKAKIHPDDLHIVADELAGLIKSEKSQTNLIENRFIDSKGKLHWFSGTMSKIYIDGKMHVQTVTRDITQKKLQDIELEKHRHNLQELVDEKTSELEEINEELHILNEELKTNNEFINKQKEEVEQILQSLKETQTRLIQSEKMASLGILTAGVAHEINNPLNFINGGVFRLENYFEKNNMLIDNEVSSSLENIKTGIDRATTIVNSLGQFSRNKENDNEVCNIQDVIDNCIVMLSHKAKEKNITFQIKYMSERNSIYCNLGKLHQVVMNIIYNSIQAVNNNGRITIKTKDVDNQVVISIKDNGCGISKENMSKITDPFFTTKAPGEGTGLGLSIAYKIINEHNGQLKFESVENEYTKATISFPLNN